MTDQEAPGALPSGTVTFFFSDIEGSTRLAQSHPEQFPALIETHHSLCRAAIAEAGGTVVRTEGDAFFAVFVEAARAVAAAVAIQKAHADQPWPEQAEIRVRIGLHTGIGELGGDDYVGIEVHRAARIAAVGHGGQIIVSDTTRALVARALADDTSLRDLGVHHLKDLIAPERLSQLIVAGLRAEFPPIRTLDGTPNNLPAQLTPFIDRGETADVVELLEAHRMVTLTGPGGTGKTRLGLEVAAETADRFEGVYFVSLAPIFEADLVAPRILTELGVPPSKEAPEDQLRSHLTDSGWLLVLDNFEQVIGAAGMIANLLAGADRLTILVTSRTALRIQGEREYPVPPLDVPQGDEALGDLRQNPSVRLFVDRAQAVSPEFELTDANSGAVAEIVAGLDGLPLAIELAAARSKLLDPETMLRRLSAVLDLAAGSGREVPDRQKTLRGAIQWSYDLLDSTGRAVLQDFAVFRGGASFDAIEAVCAATQVDMLAELEKLMDHSLIRRIDTPTGPRLVILETIREFAAEQLVAAERVDAIRDNHLSYFLALSEAEAGGLTTDPQGQSLETLNADRENLSRALEWAIETGRADTAARMVHSLWRFWHMRGPLATGRALAEQVLALDGSSARERYLALEAAGGLAYWQADLGTAEALYAESVELAESLEDTALLSNALYNLAFPVSFQERHEEAHQLLDRALALAEADQDRLTVAKILWAQGDAAFSHRDWDHAREHFEKALQELAELDDVFMKGWGHRMLGTTLLELGETETAREHLEQGLAIFGPVGDLSGISLHLLDFAHLARIEGRNERAVILLGAAFGQEKRGGTGLVLSGPNDPAVVRDALASLDEADAERLTEQGRAMSVEEAIAFALETED